MRACGGKGTPKTVDIHTCANILRGADGWAMAKFRDEAARKDRNRTLGNSEYMNHGALGQSPRCYTQVKGLLGRLGRTVASR